MVQVDLAELHPFKNHPFRVLDDKKMEETVESIQKYGVLVPIIVRQREEGGYEIIAGHRRTRGAELAGLRRLPAMIRNYTDDEATIIMVDSNIQREDILPSEKAKAYFMKYEAMKHQGRKGGGSTLEEVGEAAGESGKTVQRYIWLARLTEPLLEMVDTKRLGISQGADISFLPMEQQLWVQKILQETNVPVSNTQAARLKECSKQGTLSREIVQKILAEEKPKKRKYVIQEDRIRKYFPDHYSNTDMERIIIQLLEEWKNRQ